MNLRICSACWRASHSGTWSSLFRSSNANLDAFNSSRKTWMLSERIARCRQLFPRTSFFLVSAPCSRINCATRHIPDMVSGRSSAGLRPLKRCKGVSRAIWVWWSSKHECLMRNVDECSSPARTMLLDCRPNSPLTRHSLPRLIARCSRVRFSLSMWLISALWRTKVSAILSCLVFNANSRANSPWSSNSLTRSAN